MPSARTTSEDASSTAAESSLLLRARPVSDAQWNSRVMAWRGEGANLSATNAGRPARRARRKLCLVAGKPPARAASRAGSLHHQDRNAGVLEGRLGDRADDRARPAPETVR